MESGIAEIKTAALANRQIGVTVHVHVLAFQSEVERSLAEPYHHQTLWFQEGAFVPVVLERLRILPVTSQPVRIAADETNDDAPERGPISVGSRTPSPAIAPQARYSMKALVIALWAIAAAIVFHALLGK
jgi:hypothetical protein